MAGAEWGGGSLGEVQTSSSSPSLAGSKEYTQLQMIIFMVELLLTAHTEFHDYGVHFPLKHFAGVSHRCTRINGERSGYRSVHKGQRHVGPANGICEESVILQTAPSEGQ